MTVEFFDLARRLWAAQTGKPVLQVAARLFTLQPDAILVDTWRDGKGENRFSVGRAGGAVVSPTGGVGLLRTLAAAGAVMDPQGLPVQLVVADGAALQGLAQVARKAAQHDDDAVRGAAAVIGWWVDRAGYPGTDAVVDLLAHSRLRFITGSVPARERTAGYWRDEVFAAGPGAAGLAVWADRIGAGEELAMLEPIHEDDHYTYRAAVERFGRGQDWTRPEPPAVAAMGLRARCDAADLWEAALRSDRLWRHRGLHTGHVTGGEVVSVTNAWFTIRCPRLDCRLRPGSDVVAWINGIDCYGNAPLLYGDVTRAESHKGALLLTIARVPVKDRPAVGQWVSVMPAPPSARLVSQGRWRYRQLLFGGDSWIAVGRPPGLRRRPVPLDILCAAAETDPEPPAG